MLGNKKLLMAGLALVMVSALIFIFNNLIIPAVKQNTENRIRAEIDERAMPLTKAAVVNEKNDIPRYTVLSDEIINKRIKLVDIPVKYAVPGGITDLDSLRGKITKEDLRPGEQIPLDALTQDKKWFGEFERLKDYNVTSIVAGEVKSGNIVDILVSYGNGIYDVVVPKIKIKKLLDANKAETQVNVADKSRTTGADDSGNYIIIVAVDEEQYRDLELAGKLGKLQTRLYIDESQPASKKTFDYSFQVSRISGNTGTLKK